MTDRGVMDSPRNEEGKREMVATAPRVDPDAERGLRRLREQLPKREGQDAPVFEVFTQVGPIKENGPALTLRLDGSVTINAAAYELLGRPNFVELLYAREQRTLGLRPCAPTVAHARIVRRDKDNKRTFVSARPLLKFYGMEGARAANGPARQYGDVLAVQLTVDRAQG
jgi:hypothetical protein